MANEFAPALWLSGTVLSMIPVSDGKINPPKKSIIQTKRMKIATLSIQGIGITKHATKIPIFFVSCYAALVL